MDVVLLPVIRRVTIICLLGLAAAAPSVARAQDAELDAMPEFSLGIGYANISLEDSDAIDGEGGIRFDPVFSGSPLGEALPQLRLGAGVGFTLVLDDSRRALISNDGQVLFFGSSDVPLWLVEPELRLGWRQWFGDAFVEGGAAAGYAFGFLELEAEDGRGDSYEADDGTPYGRAFLRAGARVTGGVAGIEASWLSGDELDFGGNAAGDLREWYVGIFGALVF